jgi:hypothetical protein
MKSKTLTADVEEREQAPVESEQTQSQLASGPTLDEIRQRAYELHLEGGCVHGRDQDDWFQAERDLMEKYQAR